MADHDCAAIPCRWTASWACPGSSSPGRRGYAHDDGTDAFHCCCPPQAPVLIVPPPPPPPQQPNVFLQAFFACARGIMEGDRVPLTRLHVEDAWVVVKSRDVGEPAPRLCEAEMQHLGKTQLPLPVASAIWADLPGTPRWASFDNVAASAMASAKFHRPLESPRLEPCVLTPQGGGAARRCTVLFVAHAPNTSAPAPRKPYLGKIRRREREDAKLWRRSTQAWLGSARPADIMVRGCPDEIARHTVAAPRLYTSQGLRTALTSEVCSRACTASRLRKREANRTRSSAEPPPCLLGGAEAGCDPRRGNVLLVVSHWNADVRYLREQPFCYVVFEKSGNGQNHVLDFSVPNKANEASTYLHFLLKFFDELPETMLFLQDGRSSKHSPDILNILRHLRLDTAPYLPLNSAHMPFLSAPAFCHVERCMRESGLRRFLPSSAMPRHQMDVSYTCCAQFLVTRGAVRARPKQLYEALYRYALGASDFGHRGDSFARGECLEVLWHVLFGRPRLDAPVSPARLCGNAAAGSCVRATGLRAFVPADDAFWSWATPLWERASPQERRSMRDGQLSPFDAAVRRGLLCLGRRKECGTAAASTPAPHFDRALVAARVAPLRGQPPQLLSSNCSLLEAQSEALVPRRKLGSTLRQTCRGRAAKDAAMLLHDRALCVLYERAAATRKGR